MLCYLCVKNTTTVSETKMELLLWDSCFTDKHQYNSHRLLFVVLFSHNGSSKCTFVHLLWGKYCHLWIREAIMLLQPITLFIYESAVWVGSNVCCRSHRITWIHIEPHRTQCSPELKQEKVTAHFIINWACTKAAESLEKRDREVRESREERERQRMGRGKRVRVR